MSSPMGDPTASGQERAAARLRSDIDALIREVAAIDGELDSTRAVRANTGDDDEHDPDGIPLSAVLQVLEGQKARAVAEIRAAEGAMGDLQHGRYGICRVCSEPIPAARLEIRPTATTCVACAVRLR